MKAVRPPPLPEETRTPDPKARPARAVARAGIVWVAIFLTVLVATHPAILALDTAVVGDGGDNHQFLGFQYLAHRLFSSGDFPFGWTDYWRYPFGVEFQNVYDSTLLILLGLMLYPLLDDPIRVYNVSVLLLLFTNVGLSYVAFRTWFRPAVAYVGAAMFGLSFYSLGKVGGHVNLLTTAGFALFVSGVYRVYRERASSRSLAYLVFASLIAAFASLQYPLLLLGGLPFVTGLVAAFFPREGLELLRSLWQRKLGVALSATALVGVFSVFHGQKLVDLMRGEVAMPADSIVSVPPVNFVLPNAYLATLAASVHNSSPAWIEYTVFFGYVELLLFGLAFVTVPNRRVKGFLVAVAVVFFILSVGKPGPLEPLWPYPYLFRRMPYRGVIEPARFSIFTYLALTLLVLSLLRNLRRPVWLTIVILLLLIERFPRNFHLSATRRNPELVAAVRGRPTRAVLDLPAYGSWWNGQLYDLYSVHYGLPIVTGYVQWSGDTPRSSTFLHELRELTCFINSAEVVHEYNEARAVRKRDQILSRFREHGIRTVVLHKDLFGTEAECGAAPRYIDALFSNPEDWEIVLDSKETRVLWWRAGGNP